MWRISSAFRCGVASCRSFAVKRKANPFQSPMDPDLNDPFAETYKEQYTQWLDKPPTVTIWNAADSDGKGKVLPIMVHSSMDSLLNNAAKHMGIVNPRPGVLFTPTGNPVHDLSWLNDGGDYLCVETGSELDPESLPTALAEKIEKMTGPQKKTIERPYIGHAQQNNIPWFLREVAPNEEWAPKDEYDGVKAMEENEFIAFLNEEISKGTVALPNNSTKLSREQDEKLWADCRNIADKWVSGFIDANKLDQLPGWFAKDLFKTLGLRPSRQFEAQNIPVAPRLFTWDDVRSLMLDEQFMTDDAWEEFYEYIAEEMLPLESYVHEQDFLPPDETDKDFIRMYPCPPQSFLRHVRTLWKQKRGPRKWDFREMYSLHRMDPIRYTYDRLARMYNCTVFQAVDGLIWADREACRLEGREFDHMRWARVLKSDYERRLEALNRCGQSDKKDLWTDAQMFKDYIKTRVASLEEAWEQDRPHDDGSLAHQTHPDMMSRSKDKDSLEAFEFMDDLPNWSGLGMTTAQSVWAFMEVSPTLKSHHPFDQDASGPRGHDERRFVIRQPDGRLRTAKPSEKRWMMDKYFDTPDIKAKKGRWLKVLGIEERSKTFRKPVTDNVLFTNPMIPDWLQDASSKSAKADPW